MSSLSAEKRAALIQATKGAAAALLEDMHYLREVVVRIETSRSELRRLSAILRRLVVEGELQRIADPRMGRITLHAPDNQSYYDLAKKVNILFCSSSSAYVFGTDVGPFLFGSLGPASKASTAQQLRDRVNFDELNTFKTISLRPANFVSHRVICYAQQWVSRGAVITYVANFMSGVHSRAPVEYEELLLDRIRGACLYSIDNGKLKVHVLPELGPDSAPLIIESNHTLDFEASALDPLLIELLATARLLVESPDIARLEAILATELS